MPYPSGTYINQIIDEAVRAELEQFYSLLQGYLSAQHNDDGSHGNITTGDIDAEGAVTASGAGTFGSDVTANKDAYALAGPFESGLIGSHGNSSVLGPAVQLGRLTDAWRWFLVANTLRGTAGTVAALEFIAGKDSATFRRVMQLTQADTPVAGEYYLAPSVTGKLTIGAPSGALSAFSGAAPVDAVYTRLGIFERLRTVALGEWTAVAFDAANFTASSGLWTLTSGDQVSFAYTLVGKTMIVTFDFEDTTVSATPITLEFKIPGGFTAARSFRNLCIYSDAGAATAIGTVRVEASGTTIKVAKLTGTWGVATNSTFAIGQLVFEVQ